MKSTKPYLVTCASYTPGVDRFLYSIRKTEEAVEYLSVEFLPHFQEKPLYSVRLFKDIKYPGHMNRLQHIPFDFLDLDRWVIFSDTDDVIIQKKIPELPQDKDILVANENVNHQDGFWLSVIKQFPVFEPLLDKPVFNAGLFAMKGTVLKEYVSFQQEFIEEHKLTQPEYLDQLILNYWIHIENDIKKDEKYKYRVGYVPSLFCCLHANVEKQNCKKVNGVWCDKKDQVFVFVHANGSMKRYL